MNVMPILYSTPSGGLETQISDFLRQLGIWGKLAGHKYLVSAIAQTVDDTNRIQYITKDLYPDLAKLHSSTASKVERSMRSAIGTWWLRGNRELLEAATGFKLQRRPTNSEFIELLANHFRHHI